MGCRVLNNGQQDEVQNEQSSDHPQDGMDLFGLALAHLDNAVGDEAHGNAVGDAVAQGHENAGEEGGDGLADVVPLDFLEGGGHHHAHQHQGRGRGGGGDSADKGGQERAEGKADGNHYAGKARAAASADASGALHKGGGVAG